MKKYLKKYLFLASIDLVLASILLCGCQTRADTYKPTDNFKLIDLPDYGSIFVINDWDIVLINGYWKNFVGPNHTQENFVAVFGPQHEQPLVLAPTLTLYLKKKEIKDNSIRFTVLDPNDNEYVLVFHLETRVGYIKPLIQIIMNADFISDNKLLPKPEKEKKNLHQ